MGLGMLVGPNRPRDYLQLTQTEQEVCTYAGFALFKWLFEQYGDMWSD